jgi:cobalt-zinc-cadmium efflux system outer membrane protein
MRATITLAENWRTLRQSGTRGIATNAAPADARILREGLLPIPKSVLMSKTRPARPFKSGDEMENTLTLSQLIELGGKRPARVLEAEASRAVTEWEYEVKRVEVLKTTTLAFIDALAAQRRLELAKEIVKVADETVTLTAQRVEVGKVSAVEAIRAKVGIVGQR